MMGFFFFLSFFFVPFFFFFSAFFLAFATFFLAYDGGLRWVGMVRTHAHTTHTHTRARAGHGELRAGWYLDAAARQSRGTTAHFAALCTYPRRDRRARSASLLGVAFEVALELLAAPLRQRGLPLKTARRRTLRVANGWVAQRACTMARSGGLRTIGAEGLRGTQLAAWSSVSSHHLARATDSHSSGEVISGQ